MTKEDVIFQLEFAPVSGSTPCVRYSKVIPLCMPLSIKILPQIQLIIRISDFDNFTEVSRLETRFKMQVTAAVCCIRSGYEEQVIIVSFL